MTFRVAEAKKKMAKCHDEPGEAAAGAMKVEFVYNEAELEAGSYAVRYRARDDAGNLTRWAHDESIVVKPR